MRYLSLTEIPLGTMLVLGLGVVAPGLLAQTTKLELGKANQAELSAGETRSYSIMLDANQYMRAVVTQTVATIVVEVFTPGGKKTLEVDTRNLPIKLRRIAWVSEAAGEYRIDVSGVGQYEIKLDELRAAGSDDGKRVKAEQLLTRGLGETHKHANDQAILTLMQSLNLCREVHDREREGDVLDALGKTYRNLSQYEKAIDLFEQALANRGEVRDRQGEGSTLSNLGSAYFDLNQLEKATGYYERALEIAQEVKDRQGEGALLNNLGNVSLNLGHYEKAIRYFDQALTIRREVKDRQGEGATLSNLGNANQRESQWEKAIGFYEQALAIRREVKDRRGEGRTLTNLGSVYRYLNQYEKAVSYFDQALVIAREVKDRQLEGITLTNLGIANEALGKNEKAIGCYEQALAIEREMKDRLGESRTLTDMGIAYQDLSQNEKAIGYFEDALVIERELKDRQGERDTLTNLGIAYFGLAQYPKAIVCYEQALAISRELRDRWVEASILANLSNAYGVSSQYEKQIDSMELALAIFREVKNRAGEAGALANLGVASSNLSQHEKAINYYQQALRTQQEIKDRRGEGRTLTTLGLASVVLNQHEKAISYLDQALLIAREIGDHYAEGAILTNLGMSCIALNQHEKAISYLDQALAVRRAVKDRQGESETLNSLGGAHHGLGDDGQATSYYNQALAISRELKDRGAEAAELSNLMDIWQGSGKPRLAIFYGKEAVNTIQSVRADVAGLAQEVRQSFLKGNEQHYHTLAEILIAQGRLAEAEQVLALLKEEEYFQYTRRDADEATSLNRRVDLTREEAEWEKRYRQAGDRLTTIGTERGELLAKKSLTAEEAQHLGQLEKDLAKSNQAFENFVTDLARHFSTKQEISPRINALRQAQDVMEDLREFPAGTVMIFTVIGDEAFHAVLRTRNARKAYTYPIRATDLNHKILEFHQALQHPELDPRPLGLELYNIIVASMAVDLRKAKAKTLMWSLDGALRYVPLAALYDGKEYLIEQYRVSVMTLASDVSLRDRPDWKWKAVGFGVTREFENAPALPSVSSELRGIITTRPGDGGVLPGEVKLDDQFTEKTMRETLIKHYPVVHIASHFHFQPGDDTRSFLQLGDGGHFSLAKLKISESLFIGVQLLTLSACNTGLGDGAEVEGFGTLAQRQGAKAVLASLWPVADESTSQLMQKFYRIRESSHRMTKIEALRESQLELLRGAVKLKPSADRGPGELLNVANPAVPRFRVDPDAPFAHPFYWAPFFLMGNWR